MPLLNTKIPRFNQTGVAAQREQRRIADLEREDRNKNFPTFFLKSFGFRPFYSQSDSLNINGPLCPGLLTKDRQCLAPLIGDNESTTKAHCDVCGKNYDMPHSFQEFRGIAHRAYEGLLNSQTELITLDVPYEAVKAKSEDETREIKIVWSQKDGRNQAIIYLIEKDGNGDKAHIFVDLEREEVRHDSNDIPPGKILAKIQAEFRETKVDIEYKK